MKVTDSISIREDVLKMVTEHLVPLNLKLHTDCRVSDLKVASDTDLDRGTVERFRTGIQHMQIKTYCTLTIYYLKRNDFHINISGFVETLRKALANHECIICETASPEELAKHPEYTVLLEYKGKRNKQK